jgi:DNA-binding transcriptional LysR family regulator
MDKLRAMRTFVAIAEAGSLTAAARAESSSLPAVVRSLAALEADLGTRLFHRTTRRIALTEAGRRYLVRCREIGALLGEAEAEVRAEQTELSGNLSVTTPVLFGIRYVTNGITAFVQRYPKVNVEVELLDRMVNLLEEGIDVGIRIGILEDSSLIARPVGTMRRVTVAAPRYLAQRGTPQHPEDLRAHNCIRYARAGGSVWCFNVDGKLRNVAVDGNLGVNQSLAAAGACLAGLGIGSFFAYQVADPIASGALAVLLERFEMPPRPVHVVYPEARLLPARTRTFVEFIMQHIASQAHLWQPAEEKRRARRGKPRPAR